MRTTVLLTSIALALVSALQLGAQSPANPAFDVVSVKASNADAAGPFGGPPLPVVGPWVGGRFTATNIPLRQLIVIAYDLFDFQIAGGPEWQLSRRFDIQARAADPVSGRDALVPMLKVLLADRFQLRVHTEMRDQAISTLVAARSDGRLGAGVTRSTADCSSRDQGASVDASARAERLQAGLGIPCAIMPVPARIAGTMTMRANGASMADLAKFLTPFVGRMVRDRTGMSGLYDWELSFDRSVRPSTGVALPSDSPSLTSALREQLGLRLESARGSVEVLVIDSAALPQPD